MFDLGQFSGGSGSTGDSRTQAGHGDEPGEEARGFCARPGSEKALYTYQLVGLTL
jgi:hypothetical protein